MKMVTKQRSTPILFFNTGAEDREAYLEVRKSGMPCEFRAPSLEDSSPLLLVGYRRFVGIQEIRTYILKSKKSWVVWRREK
jgi:hypothetical protein